MDKKIEVVNLKKALKESKSKFYRNLPGFVVGILEKIIRQEQMNEVHSKYADLQGMDYVKALLFEEFKVKINISGEENIDKTKKYVYVANHPLGAIDALSFLYLIDKIHGKVISPSNQLFEYIPNLHPLIVGINVFGRNTKAAAEAVNKAFETDAQIMIFPAGEVSRRINGKIQDPKWQKTFVTKAVQYQRDIVPVHISGRNSNKFYNVARIRKALGIKTYVETMLLPQEMFKQYGINLDMTIGKTIAYQEIEKSDLTHYDWAEKIKNIVYNELAKQTKKQ